jgi:hypothetical protein
MRDSNSGAGAWTSFGLLKAGISSWLNGLQGKDLKSAIKKPTLFSIGFTAL